MPIPKSQILWFLALVLLGCGSPSSPNKIVQSRTQTDDSKTATKPQTEAATSDGPRGTGLKINRLAEEELREGWIELFDRQTLFGWEAGSDANWSVQDGVISVDDGKPGLLCTTSDWSDYVLRLEFRFAKGTNSGVFLHTPLLPTDPERDCYELNIAELEINPFPTGSFVKRLKADTEAKPDEWHQFEVTMNGAQAQVKLNGESVLEYQDPQPLSRGRIGLQFNKGLAQFRNIRLKPMGLTSLTNGKDLTGWKQVPDSGVFAATEDGLIHAKGGKARLESDATLGDFVAQVECQTYAAKLNSGIFFRCIAGEDLNGYECQIQNGFRNGNREEPEDCGTGGIFRRVNARMVVPNDQEWFRLTISASGPHISVWVDGFAVTDWTDTRDPDPNPRKGLRVTAGPLMLQSHDATTDVSFRSILAAELPPRLDP